MWYVVVLYFVSTIESLIACQFSDILGQTCEVNAFATWMWIFCASPSLYQPLRNDDLLRLKTVRIYSTRLEKEPRVLMISNTWNQVYSKTNTLKRNDNSKKKPPKLARTPGPKVCISTFFVIRWMTLLIHPETQRRMDKIESTKYEKTVIGN